MSERVTDPDRIAAMSHRGYPILYAGLAVVVVLAAGAWFFASSRAETNNRYLTDKITVAKNTYAFREYGDALTFKKIFDNPLADDDELLTYFFRYKKADLAMEIPAGATVAIEKQERTKPGVITLICARPYGQPHCYWGFDFNLLNKADFNRINGANFMK